MAIVNRPDPLGTFLTWLLVPAAKGSADQATDRSKTAKNTETKKTLDKNTPARVPGNSGLAQASRASQAQLNVTSSSFSDTDSFQFYLPDSLYSEKTDRRAAQDSAVRTNEYDINAFFLGEADDVKKINLARKYVSNMFLAFRHKAAEAIRQLPEEARQLVFEMPGKFWVHFKKYGQMYGQDPCLTATIALDENIALDAREKCDTRIWGLMKLAGSPKSPIVTTGRDKKGRPTNGLAGEFVEFQKRHGRGGQVDLWDYQTSIQIGTWAVARLEASLFPDQYQAKTGDFIRIDPEDIYHVDVGLLDADEKQTALNALFDAYHNHTLPADYQARANVLFAGGKGGPDKMNQIDYDVGVHLVINKMYAGKPAGSRLSLIVAAYNVGPYGIFRDVLDGFDPDDPELQTENFNLNDKLHKQKELRTEMYRLDRTGRKANAKAIKNLKAQISRINWQIRDSEVATYVQRFRAFEPMVRQYNKAPDLSTGLEAAKDKATTKMTPPTKTETTKVEAEAETKGEAPAKAVHNDGDTLPGKIMNWARSQWQDLVDWWNRPSPTPAMTAKVDTSKASSADTSGTISTEQTEDFLALIKQGKRTEAKTFLEDGPVKVLRYYNAAKAGSSPDNPTTAACRLAQMTVIKIALAQTKVQADPEIVDWLIEAAWNMVTSPNQRDPQVRGLGTDMLILLRQRSSVIKNSDQKRIDDLLVRIRKYPGKYSSEAVAAAKQADNSDYWNKIEIKYTNK